MNKALILLITVIAAASCGSRTPYSQATQEAIATLDQAVDNKQRYINIRQQRIDSLKSSHAQDSSVSKLIAIARAYSQFSNDSALYYFTKAATSPEATDEEAMLATIHEAALMPLSGIHAKAIELFENIDTAGCSRDLQIEYTEGGRRMYNYIASAYSDYSPYRELYTEYAINYQRHLLDLLDKDSDEYTFHIGELNMLTGDSRRAETQLSRLTLHTRCPGLLARAHHHLATIAMGNGDKDSYRLHLAHSAIIDIVSATLEVKSLQELGTALSEDGDINRSYKYLSAALDNAVSCGAALRVIESSRQLPLIAKVHNNQISSWRRTLYIIICVLGVLITVLAVTFALLYREMRHLKQARARLRQANGAKDVYISQFLHLCSIYMDKLNQFGKLVERKLSTGKSEELYKLTKSGKFIDEGNTEFYAIFDDSFLHLYPDFATQVNKLLKPDEQIHLEKNERLNTALRILAIQRMGITEAAAIAQILNYSLNTIYAYRNRIKSKAIDRDRFEEDIMNIQPADQWA